MNIITCDATQNDRWNQFVKRSPRSSFYHLAAWQAINATCFGHDSRYLAAVDAGRFVGVFPLVRVKSRLFGSIACSLPFVNFGGPCGDDEAIEEQLIGAAFSAIEDWNVDYVEIRSTRYLGPQYPCSTQKVSMTLELGADPEVLFAAFKSDHRKDIRRAYKNGFTARVGGAELLDDFYDVLSESWRDLGTPIYAKSYLGKVVDEFEDETRICVIYSAAGIPAGAALVGQLHGVVEGLWLGTRAAFRRQMVGYVLYWELIKDACLAGHHRFHLGRSTSESGGEQFKKKWNASVTQLYWHYRLRPGQDMPRLNVTNPRYRMAIAAWRRLPVPVTQRLGPIIARGIP